MAGHSKWASIKHKKKAVDAKRGVLWATTAALPQVEEFRAEDKGKSALLRIDLETGGVLETLRAADESERDPPSREHFDQARR